MTEMFRMPKSRENMEETSHCLHHLPSEIIDKILSESSLCFADLANISQACYILQEICSSNEIWKRKLMQRWSHMLERYDRHSTCIWKEECKNRCLLGRKVREMVKRLSPTYIHSVQDDIPNEGFSEFVALMAEHRHAGDFIIDELIEMINEGTSHENLTTKYYAEKVLRYIQQKLLSHKISEFLRLPPDKQRLETGAVFVAQWEQPLENVTESKVSDRLDCLASEVRELVAECHPHHPLLMAQFPTEDFKTDLWTCEQCEAVLIAINTILFKVHKFSGNQQNGVCSMFDFFIDKVLELKTGSPIVLCIIYASIARRLGVICEPVNFPSGFILRWRQHPMATQDQQFTYIDAFKCGTFHSADALVRQLNVPQYIVQPESFNVATPTKVLESITNQLRNNSEQIGHLLRPSENEQCLRSALDLAMLLTPDDLDVRLLQVRINLKLNINLHEVIDSLQTIADMDQNRMGLVVYLLNAAQTQMEENMRKQADRQIKPKTRKSTKDVKYCIGLIMRHKRYDYACVISGWDARCQASQGWVQQMGVHQLTHRDKQPFYNVLVEDSSTRYAAQENLEPHDSPGPISHPQVGRYFQEYLGSHYLPNAEYSSHYPHDEDLRVRLTREYYGE